MHRLITINQRDSPKAAAQKEDNMSKPNYCIYPKTDNCLDCHLVNYGLDCHNNPVAVERDESYAPSNWEQAPKHGLGGHALQDIQGFLPEWVFDLEPEKIGDIIKAMNANHQFGKSLGAKEIDDFFGFRFWSVDWDKIDIDNLPRLKEKEPA